MKTNTKNTLKKLGLGVSAFACLMSTGISVSADVGEGTTNVTYDNRNVIDGDDNGQWGVIIPTAISFTDENTTVTDTIELTGINGFSLSDFKSLDVTIAVTSTNKFALVNSSDISKTISYSLEDSKSTDLTSSGTISLTESNSSEDITAKLDGDKTGLTKGSYSDTLTFTFTASKVELN